MTEISKILEVEGISKKFNLRKNNNGGHATDFIYALNNVSFTLSKGESMGIIGKNGSGKSTLLKILSGIIKPDSGQAKIYGSVASILDLGFGMVPEFTGRENIFLIGSLSGYSKSKMKSVIDEIIDFAEIGEFIDQPIKNYSNGMYLRLAFSAKTILRSDLLILDEVMAVGDLKFQEKCKLKIKELCRMGTSIILVSHSLKEIVEYTRKSLIIEKGEIIKSGTTHELINLYESLAGLNELKVNPSVNYATDPESRIRVIDYKLASHRVSIINESVSASIRFEIKQPGIYDLMIYLSDFNGVILSDSITYRVDPQFSIKQPGIYDCLCEFPLNFFNVGTFYVGYIISDRKTSLFENLRCMRFDVYLNPTEKFAPIPWCIYDKSYPLRPNLNWRFSIKVPEPTS